MLAMVAAVRGDSRAHSATSPALPSDPRPVSAGGSALDVVVEFHDDDDGNAADGRNEHRGIVEWVVVAADRSVAERQRIGVTLPCQPSPSWDRSPVVAVGYP